MSNKLNWKQKVLKPIINFLVERFFPNRVFYGNDYLNVFAEYDSDGTRGKYISCHAASMFLISHMVDLNAETLDVEMNDVSASGEDVGSFTIKIQSLRDSKNFPRKLDIPEDEKIFSIEETWNAGD